MEKKTWIIIFILIVILIIILLWYAFKKSDNQNKYKGGEKCPDGSPIPASGNCGTSTSTVTPKPGECVQPSYYTEWQFPISFGMKGSRVRELQHKLNIKYMAGLDEDGYFGCKTLGAVKEYLGTDKVYTTNPIWNVPEPILG